MFGEGISFERRANFMYNNVCVLPDNLSKAYDLETTKGLADFRKLLLIIYSDIDTYKTSDNLEGYHNLTYTANLFLYAIAVTGEVKKYDTKNCLSVSKSLFKKEYKKSATFPISALQNYGVFFEYYKNDKRVDSYKQCNMFNVYFRDLKNIVLALKHLSNSFNTVNHKTEYGDAITMFAKADFERLILKSSGERNSINPLRADIVNSTLEKKNLYTKLVTGFLDLGLKTYCYYQRYCCPFWNVNFMKGKKLTCKTQIFGNYLHIAVPVPKKSVESLIVSRSKFPQTITSAIEKFNCVSCGKCKKTGKCYVRVIDGVTCCTGHSEATTIFMPLQSIEEVKAIHQIVKDFK